MFHLPSVAVAVVVEFCCGCVEEAYLRARKDSEYGCGGQEIHMHSLVHSRNGIVGMVLIMPKVKAEYLVQGDKLLAKCLQHCVELILYPPSVFMAANDVIIPFTNMISQMSNQLLI